MSSTGGQKLYVLVDYDNVSPLTRKKGVDHVLNSVFDTVADALPGQLPSEMTIRLYGGWYSGATMTRAAQALVRSAYFYSPAPRKPMGTSAAPAVLMKAELARTLISRENLRSLDIFENTLRSRVVSLDSLRVTFHGNPACRAPRCFIRDLDTLFRTGLCPVGDGMPDISQHIVRNEQKLVDVMIAADLLFLAGKGNAEKAALVSSDTDLWPAIIEAAVDLTTLVHVHTAGGVNCSAYERMVDSAHYRKVTLV